MREHDINCIYHITPACLIKPTPAALPHAAGQTSPKLAQGTRHQRGRSAARCGWTSEFLLALINVDESGKRGSV